MARGDDIEERLVDYAVRVVRVCTRLPKGAIGGHFADQLLRSGTAPAAHYAEGRTAESRKDFIHKLRLALKEANESRIWLRIIVKSDLIKGELLEDLLAEADAICRILNASIHTTQQNTQ